MAERFLEPNVPLKKIDNETGDTLYIYPQTTASQVKMDEDGTRLSTILNENILYLGDAEDGDAEVINADTLGGKTYSDIVNLIYPVGSIYMSVNETSPAVLFGGTWERIKDTFLLSAGDKYSAGAIGGEATHVLTIEEMPWHDHAIMAGYGETLNNTVDSYRYQIWGSSDYGAKTGLLGAQGKGGSQAHNNMPPYIAVYMWKRTV